MKAWTTFWLTDPESGAKYANPSQDSRSETPPKTVPAKIGMLSRTWRRPSIAVFRLLPWRYTRGTSKEGPTRALHYSAAEHL